MRPIRPVAVGAEADADACRAEPGQVARLDAEQLLRLRPVGRRCLQLLQLVGGNRIAHPAEVRGDASIRQVRHEDHVRALRDERDQLVVDIAIAHAVRKRVEARTQQPLRVLKRKDVGGDAKPVRVSLVDDRAVELWRQLLVHAVPVVHPDLDYIDVQLGQLPDRLPRLVFGRHPVRNLTSARLGPRDPAPSQTESGGIRNRLLANLVRHIADFPPEAHCRDYAIVGPALQILNERLARVRAEVRVRTRNVACSMGALSSPTMSRAPANAGTPAPSDAWLSSAPAQAAIRGRPAHSRPARMKLRRDSIFKIRIEVSSTRLCLTVTATRRRPEPADGSCHRAC